MRRSFLGHHQWRIPAPLVAARYEPDPSLNDPVPCISCNSASMLNNLLTVSEAPKESAADTKEVKDNGGIKIVLQWKSKTYSVSRLPYESKVRAAFLDDRYVSRKF